MCRRFRVLDVGVADRDAYPYMTGVTSALEPLNETRKDYEDMIARWELIGMYSLYLTLSRAMDSRVGR
jgi:hypothetical protein